MCRQNRVKQAVPNIDFRHPLANFQGEIMQSRALGADRESVVELADHAPAILIVAGTISRPRTRQYERSKEKRPPFGERL